MGGLFHFFDFNQGSMARKILARRRHVDGLEAPRNSLELQVEAFQSCIASGDNEAEVEWSENNCYPIKASMKRLIQEEISKQSNTRRNAPSIVARLMGVDMLPIETKSVVQPVDKKNGTMISKHSKGEKNKMSLAIHRSSKSSIEFDSLYLAEDRLGYGQDSGKPRPREHPHEEELQKFKKEFEAWQAARFKECSKFVERENINKQKMVSNATSGISPVEKPVLRARSRERVGLHHRQKSELFQDEQKEFISSSNRNYEQSMIDYDQKPDKSSAPTRIVILKPGPDRFCDHEESWTSLPCTLEERDSIEDFLEEVKERLKSELQGKTLKRGSAVVRGSGIETPFSEKPSDPKQIARHLAKHVRDSVTRDIGINLLRSESTRSYRSEIQFAEPNSPEFINRDTRRFLSERVRNALKREKHSPGVPLVVNGSSRSSLSDNENIRLKEMGNNSQVENLPSYWEIVKDEQEMQARSFRHGDDDGVINIQLSPRNLVRSLSAPVSGTSFGKLLLEDRHILTGAHVRRKHEALENLKMDMRKRKKERFNIKEKVSNFRYNLTLRGKLFGKKLQSMAESQGDFGKDIMSGPTVVRNFSERHIMENSTEVPPSPASVCSSPQGDFWRPVDYLSPLSTCDVTPGDDSSMPQVFREISSNLNELRRQLNQLESNKPDNSKIKQEVDEFRMPDLEDKEEAYIRDLLVASGLYHGSCDKSMSRWDPLAKPISNEVFEKSCQKSAEDNESSNKDENDHKMLYDLLNETLATVLGPPVTMSRFRRKIISSSMARPLRGKKLLDCVWEMMKVYLSQAEEKSNSSLDTMVANHLRSTPWSGFIEDEINAFGKEMESVIIAELVEEIANDILMLSNDSSS